MDISRAAFYLCIDVPHEAWLRYVEVLGNASDTLSDIHVQNDGTTCNIFLRGSLIPHEEDSLFSSTLTVNPREQGFLFSFRMWTKQHNIPVGHTWQLQGYTGRA